MKGPRLCVITPPESAAESLGQAGAQAPDHRLGIRNRAIAALPELYDPPTNLPIQLLFRAS